MKKDPGIFIAHMLECLDEIDEYTDGMEIVSFIEDRRTQNAVLRLLEVMGEAAKNLPEDFRERHHEVNWRRLTGMRDVIAHEYFAVDYAIVWAVITRELPNLRVQLLRIVEQ